MAPSLVIAASLVFGHCGQVSRADLATGAGLQPECSCGRRLPGACGVVPFQVHLLSARSVERAADQVQDGAYARPVLLGDSGTVAAGCSDLLAVGILNCAFTCDLSLVPAHAGDGGLQANWPEVAARVRKDISPEIEL